MNEVSAISGNENLDLLDLDTRLAPDFERPQLNICLAVANNHMAGRFAAGTRLDKEHHEARTEVLLGVDLYADEKGMTFWGTPGFPMVRDPVAVKECIEHFRNNLLKTVAAQAHQGKMGRFNPHNPIYIVPVVNNTSLGVEKITYSKVFIYSVILYTYPHAFLHTFALPPLRSDGAPGTTGLSLLPRLATW